jgi:hypothetical protein
MSSYDKLDVTELPSIGHKCWMNDLKGGHILEEEYTEWERSGREGVKPPNKGERFEQIKNDWFLKGWANMGDYLKYYNEQDVKPFVKAVIKLRDLYSAMDIDIFKRSVGVPSASRIMLFRTSQKKGVNFALCDESDKDMYLLFKAQLVAGPSIVFTRYMEAGVTA